MRSLLAVAAAIGLLVLIPRLLEPEDPSTPGGGGVPTDRPRPQGGEYSCPVPGSRNLNPLTQNGAVAERYVLRYTHDTLFDRDPRTGELRPAAAASMEVSDGGRSVDFILRESLRFSDGETYSREDLGFLIGIAGREELSPKSASSSWLSEAASLEIPDRRGGEPLRLRVGFDEPSRTKLQRFATSVRLIQKKFFVDRALAAGLASAGGPSPWESREFVDFCSQITACGPGTGPYVFPEAGEGRQSGSILLAAHWDSWHRSERPETWNLAGIRLRLISEPAAVLAAVLNEEVDFITGIEADLRRQQERYRVLGERFHLLSIRPDHLGTWFVGWNLERAPLDRVEVRRALGDLCDRKGLAKLLYGPQGQPAYGYYRDASRTPPEFDPSRTRAELQRLGLDLESQPPLSLLYARGTPVGETAMTVLRDGFARCGWPLALQGVAADELEARLDEGNFDLVILYSERSWPQDPFEAFHSTRNRFGYSSPEMDRLLDALRSETDPERSRELFAAFEERLAADCPITPLVFPSLSLLLHNRFRGVEPSPLGLSPETWWIEPGDRLRDD